MNHESREGGANSEEALDKLIYRYYAAQERGEKIDPDAYVDANPGFETELRSFFANVNNLEGALQQPFAMNERMVKDSERLTHASTVDSLSSVPDRSIEGSNVRIRDYRLLEEIGRGGMGVVFKAKQQNLDRTVALKMILAGQLATESEVSRFYREAKAAAALKHPGIVAIHDIGSDRGCHFFTMDFVEGESLAELLHEGAMDPKAAAELMEEVARAIEYAHDHRILHRDLKPGNVLIDDAGRPRVVDFGLAKTQTNNGESAKTSLTATGEILGTPSYMSPEQAAAANDKIGATSDVYSMGAILYACLCGRAPFVAATTVETIRQVMDKEPVALRLLSPQVPKDLETICLKCLQKDPNARFQSAGEFAEDLRRYLNGRPIVARPVSIATHGYRWARRNPWAALALTLIFLLLLSGPILTAREIALRRESDANAWRATKLAAEAESSADRAVELQHLAEDRAQGEELAKQRALLESQHARRRQFIAEMNLIRYHWELGNATEVTQLHQAQIPISDDVEDLREFTWGVWAHRLESAQSCDLGATPMPHAILTRVSPDLNRIALAGRRGQIHVRRLSDVDSDDEFVLPIISAPKIILGIAFVLDGDTLAVREATSLVVWDLKQSPPAHSTFPLAASMEGSLGRNTFSKNGRFLTVTSGNETDIWDLVEGEIVRHVELPVKPINLRHLTVEDDGARLITSTGMIWNLTDSEVVSTLHDELYTNEVAPAPNGQGFVTLDGQRELAWWTPDGEKTVLAKPVIGFDVSQETSQFAWATMRGVFVASPDSIDKPRVIHQRGILALSFDHTGNILTGVSADRLYRWELDSLDLGEPHPLDHWARGVAFDRSPNGRYYAGYVRGHVCLWDTIDGRLIQRTAASANDARGPITDEQIRDLSVSDMGHIAMCSMRGDVDLWDGRTGVRIRTLEQPGLAADPATAVAQGLTNVEISATGEVVTALTLGGEGLVWNLDNGSVYSFDAQAHFTTPPRMSPDGKTIVIWRKDTNRIGLWDVHQAKWDEERPAELLGFEFQGRWAYASATDDSIRILESQTGELLLSLGGHGGLQSISATPDGTTIATLSADGSLVIWDSRLQAPLFATDAEPGELAFVDDGRVLSLIQRDGMIRLWKSRSHEGAAPYSADPSN